MWQNTPKADCERFTTTPTTSVPVAELEELKDKIKKLEGGNVARLYDRISQYIRVIKNLEDDAELQALHDKIEELEGDKERLDFIAEHTTGIHFDQTCDSLIYSDQKHFGNCQWLRTAIDKARK